MSLRRRIVLPVAAAIVLFSLAALAIAHRQTRAALADADRFRGAELTAESLPSEWKRALLAVEDPGFYRHHGIDVRTPGSGWTTITQALAKRYYFAHFHKGLVSKTWQSFCALVLDRELAKDRQLTLFLNTAGFGPGRSGWIEGFPAAARELFGKPVGQLERAEFVSLVAMVIAPADLQPRDHERELAERVRRIERLLAGRCSPLGFRDVWLEGCR